MSIYLAILRIKYQHLSSYLTLELIIISTYPATAAKAIKTANQMIVNSRLSFLLMNLVVNSWLFNVFVVSFIIVIIVP
jgi:hypothetical protein